MKEAGTVTVEVNGKSYTGRFSVDKGMVTVSTAYGRKTTQLGGSPAETLARIMLGEMVREGKA